ncbi:MAG: AarF/ABC1/UbiB kinase family protein [Pseudomonadota bacterium]
MTDRSPKHALPASPTNEKTAPSSLDDDSNVAGVAVPASRASRLAGFSGIAAGVAGDVLANGARQLVRGERVALDDLILTPGNAKRLADQLARMRGAAMKVGQLLSMEAGDLIPEEFSVVLARLRSAADPMPPRQLKQVLTREWGKGWLTRFDRFEPVPLAAASIGQVHRARSLAGEELAIKIQYPGVRDSIDSDVDNVGVLIRMAGVLPSSVDIQHFLEEAKRQLHEEANYEHEAEHLSFFYDQLTDDNRFIVPKLASEFTTSSILAMSFVAGEPIETLEQADQATRDRVVTDLIHLVMRELFEWQTMQTDPNYANYQIDPQTGQIILFDFGATRQFDDAITAGYLHLMGAALNRDMDAADKAMRAIGYFDEKITAFQHKTIMSIINMVLEPILAKEVYQFGQDDLIVRIRDKGMTMRNEKFSHVPPIDTLFLQRKFGGLFFLASKLKARVPVRAILQRYCSGKGH